MKFIIGAMWFNSVWENTSFSNPDGENLMYIENEGFVGARYRSLDKATKYDYEEAKVKLDELNRVEGSNYPDHGFVMISATFKTKTGYYG